MSEQKGWRLCRKCLSSCYAGLTGVCVAGGPHDFDGSQWYAIPTAPPSGVQAQEGWRWCNKCQILFHPGLGAGVCPAGGGHDQSGSGPYHLAIAPYASTGQEGWRYCGKCHAMHLPGASAGSCPAGGVHTATPSAPYSMRLADPPGCSIPHSQPGWRRCRKCHSSCFGGNTGACAAGGRHDFQGSAWYGIPTEAPLGGNSQDGWRWCKKCQVLFHPGLGAGSCPTGGGHEQDLQGCSYRLAITPYTTDGQDGWRYCVKCHGLQLRDGSAGACPAGGEHTDSSSLSYSMLVQLPLASTLRNSQPGWRRCRKCQASCFGGIPGVCASGGKHDFGDSEWYCLPTEPPYGVEKQDGWRYCQKCQVLFHPGLGVGVCPAGGGHEVHPTGCNYPLAISPYSFDGQEGWRYCGKCHVMHLPGTSPGACAAGGVHTDTASGAYVMLLGPPILPGEQSGWRRCRKCQASCYAKLPGVCVSGGQHDFAGSAWYSLATAAPKDGNYQDGWRWCKKCQILFHPGLGVGVCPVGGGHENPPGNPYQLAIAPYASSGQEGWRYCAKCHVLHRVDGSAGPCAAGGQHTDTPSAPYSMRLQNQLGIQCKLITDYDEKQQPQSRFEVVLIPRGVDGSLLRNSVVKVLASAPVNIIREGKGTATLQGLDSGSPLLFTTSAMGRIRFTIVPTHDKLSTPDLFAQSAAMGADQWVKFSPDDELHTQLAGLTGEKLVATPAGKAGPLLPPSRAADAHALATGVSQVMSRFSPQAATSQAAVAFGFWDDISDGFESAGNAVADGVTSAVAAAAAAAQQATAVANSVYATIASQTNVAIDSASRYLDTVGAGAQLLIQNANSALTVPVEHFVTNSISSATQLAIDVSNEVTVLALEVVDGVRRLVKIVVQTVESAAMIAVEFFKRVGLTIKAVIEFLAALFDWGAILRLQGEIQEVLNDRLEAFAGTVSQQRPKLAAYLQEFESKLDSWGSSSSGAQGEASSASKQAASAFLEIAAVGGKLGFLLDKLASHLADGLGVSFDLGLSSMPNLPTPSASDIDAFASSFTASPLFTAFQDPTTLIDKGVQWLIELLKPLARLALKLVGALADGVLALASTLVTAIRGILDQRISIPILTNFIELVVFGGKKSLTFQSLVTLFAAVLLHTMRAVAKVADGPFSFADSAEDIAGLCCICVAAVLNWLQVLIPPGKLGDGWRAFMGLIGAALGAPFTFTTASGSFLIVEQWFNWCLNLIAASVQWVSAAFNLMLSPLDKQALTIISAGCALLMVDSALAWDTAAIILAKGDRTLAGFDLVSQVYSAMNNVIPLMPDKQTQLLMQAGSNVGTTGMSIAIIAYSESHTKARLGIDPLPES